MNTDANLPAAPLPATVDLRDFPYMPLDVVRLRDSELAVKTAGDEFRCAVLLWCAAWHQVPAGSLPDDDALLAVLAGFGRALKEWRKVKAGAMRGFERHSDGRLYHPVVVEKALDAWRSRLTQRWRTDCSRIKKQAQRSKAEARLPAFDAWMSRECPEAVPYLSSGTPMGTVSNVPEDSGTCPQGHPPIVPAKTSPREGKGSEVKTKTTPATSTETTPPVRPAAGAVPPDGEGPKPVSDSLSLEALRVGHAVGTRQHEAAGALHAVLSANGCKGTASHPQVVEWASQGVTVELLRKAIAEARKSNDGQLNPAYLAPIIERIRKGGDRKRETAAWATDDGACEAKARELGLWPAKPGEDWDGLRTRIRAAMSHRAEEGVR